MFIYLSSIFVLDYRLGG